MTQLEIMYPFFHAGVLGRAVTRADFKSCVSFTDPYANDVKLNLLTVVMGVPKLIFSRICHTSELIFYTLQILIDFQEF